MTFSIKREKVCAVCPYLLFLFLPSKLTVVHLRKNVKFLFSQKWPQRFSSNFVGLLYIRTPTIWHYRLFPKKILVTGIIFFKFSVRQLTQRLIQLTNPVQIRHLESHCKYLQLVFFVFDLPSKLIVHRRKKFKIFIFSKMSPTIFIKFCGFIVHSNPNNMALSAFPENSL